MGNEQSMIPITKPVLGEEEAAAARDAILSGWVTQGPRVQKFEELFAERVGSQFACAVSSCTTALHIALKAVGVSLGDVVITVSHTFIATANAIRNCGAEPVFVDIDPVSYNMSYSELERFLNQDCVLKNKSLFFKHHNQLIGRESPLRFLQQNCSKTGKMGRVAAIMPVHQMGIPCDIQAIVRLANKYNIPVVEDAACAIGSEFSIDNGLTWQTVGQPIGNVACFSFHPRKILTTGDGGMLTTNNSELYEKFQLLRHHGMSISDTTRHSSSKIVFENYITTAYNYRLTDIQAAIGIEQLKRLNILIQERRKLSSLYHHLLKDVEFIDLFLPLDTIRPNWQSYPIRLKRNAGFDQKQFMQRLLNNGIATRRGIMNVHQEPAYSDIKWVLPFSEIARDNTILLPLFSGLKEEQLRYIVQQIKNCGRID